ncbi:MAG TPA: response regulator [Xanthomonadaceae bacterium]|nr:response regulator [Xanthomonadaceae bacterium]
MLVDDHDLVRAGLRSIVEAQPDMKIAAEAASGEEAVRLAKTLKPDVILMDLNLPGIGGLGATERIVRSKSQCRIVVVSAQTESPFPRRLLEAGALAYVTKAGPADELLQAIRAVAQGRRFLASDIARQMALDGLSGKSSPVDELSKRELAVALKLAEGLSQQDIAKQMNLSPKTVQTYKARLFDKLDVENNVALARLLSKHGLLA